MKKKAPKKPRARQARCVADTVAVLCPHCGEGQPNTSDGSEQWPVEDFRRLTTPNHECVSCELPMFIFTPSRVQFQL